MAYVINHLVPGCKFSELRIANDEERIRLASKDVKSSHLWFNRRGAWMFSMVTADAVNKRLRGITRIDVTCKHGEF